MGIQGAGVCGEAGDHQGPSDATQDENRGVADMQGTNMQGECTGLEGLPSGLMRPLGTCWMA